MRIKRSIRRTWVLSVEEWFRFESEWEFEEEEEKSYETTTIEFRVLNTNESNICKDEDKENGEQEEEHVTKDVRAYFNLDDPIPLKDLFEQFSKADPYRFGRLERVRARREDSGNHPQNV